MKRLVLGATVVAGLGVWFALDARPSEAGGTENLTDRCGGEVAFPPTYGGKPTDPGTGVLKRENDGYSPVSSFEVKPDGDGRVRWWCHSTKGNVFDPGTWRVKVDKDGAKACLLSVATPVNANGATVPQCLKMISVSTASFEGWTAERSRCENHSTKLKARLGPDRLLTTTCLGK